MISNHIYFCNIVNWTTTQNSNIFTLNMNSLFLKKNTRRCLKKQNQNLNIAYHTFNVRILSSNCIFYFFFPLKCINAFMLFDALFECKAATVLHITKLKLNHVLMHESRLFWHIVCQHFSKVSLFWIVWHLTHLATRNLWISLYKCHIHIECQQMKSTNTYHKQKYND